MSSTLIFFDDVSEPLSCPCLLLHCFVALNDFARFYEIWEKENLISSTRKRDRKGKLSLGDMEVYHGAISSFCLT